MPDEPVLTSFPSPMGNGLLVKVFDPQTGAFGTGFFGQLTTPRDNETGEARKPLPARGIVTARGPGTYHAGLDKVLRMGVEVGDEVLFFDQFAQPLEIDGEPLVLLGEENVMVVVSRTSVVSSGVED